MCEKAVEYAIDTLQFNRLVGSSLPMLKSDQVNDFFEQIVTARKAYSPATLQIRPNGNFGPRPGSKGELLAKKNQYCPAGRDLVAVDPDNNVYGCPFLMHTEGLIGKYKKGKITLERELLGGRRDTCLAHLLNSPQTFY